MDTVKAALFEDVLKQSESAAANFERTVEAACAGQPGSAERAAAIMHAYQMARTADINFIKVESAYPHEFPVFAEAWHAARGDALPAAAAPGVLQSRLPHS